MSGTLAPSTPTNRRLAGITSFTVNGSTFNVTEFSWDPGPVERETLISLSGVDGYKESPVAAYISGKFRDAQSVNVSGFVGLTNATIVVQLANGKQVVGHNLWYIGRPGVTGADATFDFRFEGTAGTVQELGVG
jgi:tail tube protein